MNLRVLIPDMQPIPQVSPHILPGTFEMQIGSPSIFFGNNLTRRICRHIILYLAVEQREASAYITGRQAQQHFVGLASGIYTIIARFMAYLFDGIKLVDFHLSSAGQ